MKTTKAPKTARFQSAAAVFALALTGTVLGSLFIAPLASAATTGGPGSHHRVAHVASPLKNPTTSPVPYVKTISPDFGPVAGGTFTDSSLGTTNPTGQVTITGSGFTRATGVKFDTVAAPSGTWHVESDSSIVVRPPKSSAGNQGVFVTVTTPSGTSATSCTSTAPVLGTPIIQSYCYDSYFYLKALSLSTSMPLDWMNGQQYSTPLTSGKDDAPSGQVDECGFSTAPDTSPSGTASASLSVLTGTTLTASGQMGVSQDGGLSSSFMGGLSVTLNKPISLTVSLSGSYGDCIDLQTPLTLFDLVGVDVIFEPSLSASFSYTFTLAAGTFSIRNTSWINGNFQAPSINFNCPGTTTCLSGSSPSLNVQASLISALVLRVGPAISTTGIYAEVGPAVALGVGAGTSGTYGEACAGAVWYAHVNISVLGYGLKYGTGGLLAGPYQLAGTGNGYPSQQCPLGSIASPTPILSSLSPTHGSGGTNVTITGRDFGYDSTVEFGSSAATNVIVDQWGTQITATAPPGSGVQNVTVKDQSGSSTTSPAGQFTYTAASTPTRTTLTSSSNPSQVGDRVTFSMSTSPTPDGGTWKVTDGGVTVPDCSALSLSSGLASCSVTYSVPGSHTIAASYSGDAKFAASTSSNLNQVVAAPTRGTPPLIELLTPSITGNFVSVNGVTSPTTRGATITSISLSWGDGQSSSGSFPFSHTYAASGSYTITATSTDSNGLTASSAVSATVSVPAPNFGPLITSFTASSSSVPSSGGPVTLNWSTQNEKTCQIQVSPALPAFMTMVGCNSSLSGTIPQNAGTAAKYIFTLYAWDSNGTATSATVVVTQSAGVTSQVDFFQSSLPNSLNCSQTPWSVTLGGVTQTCAAPGSGQYNIVFYEPNGSYSFTVIAPAGYTVTPSSGIIVVNSSKVPQGVTFSQVSTNSGWTESIVPQLGSSAYGDISCSGNYCYVLAREQNSGQWAIWSSRNGGASWSAPFAIAPPQSCGSGFGVGGGPKNGLRCLAAQGSTAYVVGEDSNSNNIVWFTTNGGQNWSTEPITNSSNSQFYSIACTSTTTCYIVGINGVSFALWQTASSGQSWNETNVGTSAFDSSFYWNYPVLSCPQAGICILANTSGPTGAAETLDGGQTWQKFGPTGAMAPAGCATTNFCWVTVAGQTMSTSNGGSTWNGFASNNPVDIECLNSTWCVSYSSQSSQVFQFVGGTSWTAQTFPNMDAGLESSISISSAGAFVVGLDNSSGNGAIWIESPQS